MNSHPLKGAFQPEELTTLKAIFDEVTHQPWFAKDEAIRLSFAKYLIETFPGSSFDPARHRSMVEASARTFHGLDEAV
jgi:hypothetical protein